ncbi:MAG: hypothetical protein QOC56_2704, partial [Alphaproteobacteria bacterium]|nr:hypothetical protein [Alphaproteobacteria bacterium]
MAYVHPDALAYRRKYFVKPDGRRFLRTNAHLAIRHDAYRFIPPGAPRYVGKDVVRYFLPNYGRDQPRSADGSDCIDAQKHAAVIAAECDALLELKRALAELKFEIMLAELRRKTGYNPSQSRVPAGSRDGGQWTSEGGAGGADRVRLAAADGPNLSRALRLKILMEVAKKVIDAYRSKGGLRDLFGSRIGAVTYTEFDGRIVYGSNSSLPSYGTIDRVERDQMIARYVQENPQMEEKARLGQMPV